MQKEQYVFQTIVNDVMNKFLQGNSIDTCVIGIQILTNLTIEMNQVTDILILACKMLSQRFENNNNICYLFHLIV